ncbi:MAG: YitT family protein [Erysipelotrichaceae bacterium]|nr:YitT family protein [Erysipelotrichaceae bacterium]MBR3693897.1 YitT family protein [Erysipelotrichales bacterium]
MKDWKKIAKNVMSVCFMALSALVYSVSIKVFVNAGDLFPSGFSGISQLIVRTCSTYFHIEVPFALVYLLLNVGPTILVYRHVGKRFTILSIIQYVLVSFFVSVLPQFPITQDMLLIAVFGGIIAGAGNSIALINNASTGGMDFLAIFASSKYNMPTWNYVMMANASVLTIAGLLFGWEKAMYSIIFQFCNTSTVSKLHKRYQLRALFFVTENPVAVKQAIFKTVRHGITVFNCEGGYTGRPKTFLYMTCNAFQVNDIISHVMEADPAVFVNIMKTDKIVGNYYQPPLE